MSEALRKRWLDKSWRYTRSESTDISRTFAKARKAMKDAEALRESENVKPIRSAKGK